MKKENKPSLIEASIMLVIIIATIAIGVIAFKIAPAIAILSAIGIVMIYTAVKRLSFETIHEGIVSGITPGIVPIFIFILQIFLDIYVSIHAAALFFLHI